MNRRKPELQEIDLATWPTVADTDFDPVKRAVFEARRDAVERYVRGQSLTTIEEATGINRRQLYRSLQHALAPHCDGRLFGYRGLIKNVRTAEYTRVKAVRIHGDRGSCGASGALTQLFERYPSLVQWLRLQIKQRRVLLYQINTDGRLRIRLVGLQSLHEDFLRQCRTVGLTAADYPFNTASRAIRSISQSVRTEMLRSFGTAARSAGASHLKGLPPSDRQAGALAATRPYQVVEFDGHRLDLRLKVVMRDPLGFEHEFEIERVWLLVLIDVCTRAVIGYHVVMGREYSRYDVIKTIENALEPHRARTFTIAGLSYEAHGGFPSQRLPELAYAIWEQIKLDNAKANLASDTLKALCEFVGCLVDAGPRHSPDDRPYIERFFGTIASRLSSRLPGYTGSHPRDLRRTLADPKSNLRLFVSFDELEELVEYAISKYNGTPHGGLNHATPLEAMDLFVRGRQSLVTWLPEYHRRTLCLMQSARRCSVRGYLQQGVRPHINLYGVRYTSELLATSPHLLGQKLLVYMNADDLRCVRAFLSDGSDLGKLDAQGAWCVFPHNLKLRQEINKLKGRGRCPTVVGLNPIESYIQEKFAGAKKTRKGATEYARAVRMLASAPTVRTQTGPGRPAQSDLGKKNPDSQSGEQSHQSSSVSRDAKSPARPRKLDIGAGHVF